MVAEKLGIVLEDQLSSGFSTSISTLSNPSLRTLFRNWYIILSVLRYRSLPKGEPFRTPINPAAMALMTWVGLATSKVPVADAGNDEQLGRLKENENMALLHQEPGNDRSEDHDNAYDGEHACPPGADVM